MSVYEKISGFADEISQDFDQQLKTVTDLGMKYICIRSAEHKGIADYTPEEVRTVLLPKLQAAGVGVSSGVAETVCFGAASVGAASACTTRPVIMYLRPKVQNAITMLSPAASSP